MPDIFDEVLAQAKRSPDPKAYATALALKMAAKACAKEIKVLRDQRRVFQSDTRRPELNGAAVLLDMHALEYEAMKQLCPDLKKPHPESQKKAMAWILKQPWAAEYAAPAFEKRYF